MFWLDGYVLVPLRNICTKMFWHIPRKHSDPSFGEKNWETPLFLMDFWFKSSWEYIHDTLRNIPTKFEVHRSWFAPNLDFEKYCLGCTEELTNLVSKSAKPTWLLCSAVTPCVQNLLIWPSSAREMGLHTCGTSLIPLSSLRVKGLTQRCNVWNNKDYKLARTLLNFQGGIKHTNNNSCATWATWSNNTTTTCD